MNRVHLAAFAVLAAWLSLGSSRVLADECTIDCTRDGRDCIREARQVYREAKAGCRADGAVCRTGCPGVREPCRDQSDWPQDLVERSSKLVGLTTVEWNSAFIKLGHVCGDPITLSGDDLAIDSEPVGAVEFIEFVDVKRHPFTPTTRRDPVAGTIDAGTTATVVFTGLHYDANCNVYIGNSHFKARVQVDKDGNGTRESIGFLGVNVHVESLADCGP